MQDIAGSRIIVPSLEIQKFVRDVIVQAMEQRGHSPRVKDTRAEGDELGYRAIHVLLDWPPRTAEIQIRTRPQQIWAQLVERIDQTLSSDLKHGNGPAESNSGCVQ